MDELFKDMQRKGLVSTSRQKIDLSKLTVKQAAFYGVLTNSTNYLKRDYLDWQDYLRANRN